MEITSPLEEKIEFYHLEFDNIIAFSQIEGNEFTKENRENIRELVKRYRSNFTNEENYRPFKALVADYLTNLK